MADRPPSTLPGSNPWGSEEDDYPVSADQTLVIDPVADSAASWGTEEDDYVPEVVEVVETEVPVEVAAPVVSDDAITGDVTDDTDAGTIEVAEVDDTGDDSDPVEDVDTSDDDEDDDSDDEDDKETEDSEYIQKIIGETEADVEAEAYTEEVRKDIIERARKLEVEGQRKETAKKLEALQAEAARIQDIELAAEKVTLVPTYIHGGTYWDEDGPDGPGFYSGDLEKSEAYATQLAKTTDASVLVVAPVAMSEEEKKTQIDVLQEKKEDVLAQARVAQEQGLTDLLPALEKQIASLDLDIAYITQQPLTEGATDYSGLYNEWMAKNPGKAHVIHEALTGLTQSEAIDWMEGQKKEEAADFDWETATEDQLSEYWQAANTFRTKGWMVNGNLDVATAIREGATTKSLLGLGMKQAEVSRLRQTIKFGDKLQADFPDLVKDGSFSVAALIQAGAKAEDLRKVGISSRDIAKAITAVYEYRKTAAAAIAERDQAIADAAQQQEELDAENEEIRKQNLLIEAQNTENLRKIEEYNTTLAKYAKYQGVDRMDGSGMRDTPTLDIARMSADAQKVSFAEHGRIIADLRLLGLDEKTINQAASDGANLIIQEREIAAFEEAKAKQDLAQDQIKQVTGVIKGLDAAAVARALEDSSITIDTFVDAGFTDRDFLEEVEKYKDFYLQPTYDFDGEEVVTLGGLDASGAIRSGRFQEQELRKDFGDKAVTAEQSRIVIEEAGGLIPFLKSKAPFETEYLIDLPGASPGVKATAVLAGFDFKEVNDIYELLPFMTEEGSLDIDGARAAGVADRIIIEYSSLTPETLAEYDEAASNYRTGIDQVFHLAGLDSEGNRIPVEDGGVPLGVATAPIQVVQDVEIDVGGLKGALLGSTMASWHLAGSAEEEAARAPTTGISFDQFLYNQLSKTERREDTEGNIIAEGGEIRSPEWKEYFEKVTTGQSADRPLRDPWVPDVDSYQYKAIQGMGVDLTGKDLPSRYKDLNLNSDVIVAAIKSGQLEATEKELRLAGLSDAAIEDLQETGTFGFEKTKSFLDHAKFVGLDIIPVVGTTRIIVRSAAGGFNKAELAMIAGSLVMDVVTVMTLGAGSVVTAPLRGSFYRGIPNAIKQGPAHLTNQELRLRVRLATHSVGSLLTTTVFGLPIVAGTIVAKVASAPLRYGVKAALATKGVAEAGAVDIMLGAPRIISTVKAAPRVLATKDYQLSGAVSTKVIDALELTSKIPTKVISAVVPLKYPGSVLTGITAPLTPSTISRIVSKGPEVSRVLIPFKTAGTVLKKVEQGLIQQERSVGEVAGSVGRFVKTEIPTAIKGEIVSTGRAARTRLSQTGTVVKTLGGMADETFLRTAGFPGQKIVRETKSLVKETWDTPLPTLAKQAGADVVKVARHPIEAIRATRETFVGKRVLHLNDVKTLQAAMMQGGTDFADAIDNIAGTGFRKITGEIQWVDVMPTNVIGTAKYYEDQGFQVIRQKHLTAVDPGEGKVVGYRVPREAGDVDEPYLRIVREFDSDTMQTTVSITRRKDLEDLIPEEDAGLLGVSENYFNRPDVKEVIDEFGPLNLEELKGLVQEFPPVPVSKVDDPLDLPASKGDDDWIVPKLEDDGGDILPRASGPPSDGPPGWTGPKGRGPVSEAERDAARLQVRPPGQAGPVILTKEQYEEAARIRLQVGDDAPDAYTLQVGKIDLEDPYSGFSAADRAAMERLDVAESIMDDAPMNLAARLKAGEGGTGPGRVGGAVDDSLPGEVYKIPQKEWVPVPLSSRQTANIPGLTHPGRSDIEWSRILQRRGTPKAEISRFQGVMGPLGGLTAGLGITGPTMLTSSDAPSRFVPGVGWVLEPDPDAEPIDAVSPGTRVTTIDPETISAPAKKGKPTPTIDPERLPPEFPVTPVRGPAAAPSTPSYDPASPIIPWRRRGGEPLKGPGGLPIIGPIKGPGQWQSPGIEPIIGPIIGPDIGPGVSPGVSPGVGPSISPGTGPSISPSTGDPSIQPTGSPKQSISPISSQAFRIGPGLTPGSGGTGTISGLTTTTTTTTTTSPTTETVTQPEISTGGSTKAPPTRRPKPPRRRPRTRRRRPPWWLPEREGEDPEDPSISKLLVKSTPTGAGRGVPKTRKIKTGKMIKVNAVAHRGWKFDHWEGDIAGQDPSSKSFMILMDDDKELTAVFIRSGTTGKTYIHKFYPEALKEGKSRSELSRLSTT